MANCNDLFLDFHEAIKLTEGKKDFLRTSRNAIRDKIKKYFSDNKLASPEGFRGQGSYAINTVVNPLNGEYDIDDGVYFSFGNDKAVWPKPDEVRKWIVSALKNQTDKEPINKKNCVRIIYANEYHVDLPVYSLLNNDPYLAVVTPNDWQISDPQKYIEWFNNHTIQQGEQLRRIVRYLKACRDYKKQISELPSSIILTTLVALQFCSSVNDDASFTKTISNISSNLNLTGFHIVNPVNSEEVLSDRVSQNEKDNLLALVNDIVRDSRIALNTDDKRKRVVSGGTILETDFNLQKR